MQQSFFSRCAPIVGAVVLIFTVIGCRPSKDGSSTGNTAVAKNDNVRIAKETTRITEPLDESGYVDYLGAVSRAQMDGVDPGDNFAVVLWEMLDPQIVQPADREAFFSPMAFDFSERGGARMPRLASPRGRSETASLLAGPVAPWKPSQRPTVAALLARNGRQLEYAARQLKRSRFRQPYVGQAQPSMIRTPLYGIIEMKYLGRMFAIRAMLHLGSGEVEPAVDDALACQRIGWYLLQRETAIELSIGYEVALWSAEAARRLLEDGRLAGDQARRLFEGLVVSPIAPRLGEVLDRATRWSALEIAQLAARCAQSPGHYSPDVNPLPTWAFAMPIDFNESLKMINQWYDRGVAALRSSSHEDVLRQIDQLYRDLDKLKQQAGKPADLAPGVIGRRLGEIWVVHHFINMRQLYLRQVEAVTRCRMAVTAAAALVYKAENGSFPMSTAQLAERMASPEYLVEPQSGKPFVLTVVDNGLRIAGSAPESDRPMTITLKPDR